MRIPQIELRRDIGAYFHRRSAKAVLKPRAKNYLARQASAITRLSNHHKPLHPSPRLDIVCASHAACHHQGKVPAQSRHRTCRHPTVKAHLPAVQRHDPPAVASHTPDVRCGPQGTENLNGSCENLNQCPPKSQHDLRVFNDAKYSLLNISWLRGGWGNRGKYAQQGMTEMGAIALSLSRVIKVFTGI